MTRRFARSAVLAATGALALTASGCGEKHDTVTHADTEGIYLDVGRLDYQIQGSRQLNPAVVPDNKYLSGLPQGILPPSSTETWFGVFVRVQNQTKEPQPTAEEFEIVDTEERVYKPLEVQAQANAFAYQPRILRPNQTLPLVDSAEALNSVAGSLLLFKLPLKAYENRPLEFKIKAPDGQEPAEAVVDLDL
jgi:hypothetical protein